jgi:hypothetical protein
MLVNHSYVINKRCCNPVHLYLATNSENIAHAADDGIYLKTRSKGEKYWNHILDEEDVRDIKRKLRYMKGKDIAAEYNVRPTTISHIKVGKTWRHVSLND